jgi:uncharacterized protein YegP (UPF0339 family)
VIAVGEAYETKASAKNGIASVQKNAPERLKQLVAAHRALP